MAHLTRSATRWSCHILSLFFLYFFILAYCLVNTSIINILIVFLVLLDALSLVTLRAFRQHTILHSSPTELSLPPSPSLPIPSQGNAQSNAQSNSQTHLLTTHREKASFTPTATSVSSELSLFPHMRLRTALFVAFIIVFLIHMLVAAVPREWLDGLPLWARHVVFLLHGGAGAYQHVFFEYCMLLLIACFNHVYTATRLLRRTPVVSWLPPRSPSPSPPALTASTSCPPSLRAVWATPWRPSVHSRTADAGTSSSRRTSYPSAPSWRSSSSLPRSPPTPASFPFSLPSSFSPLWPAPPIPSS